MKMILILSILFGISFINPVFGKDFKVTYPVESFFYPYHLGIALITSAIFLIIVLSYRHYLIRKHQEQEEKNALKQGGPALKLQVKGLPLEEKLPPPTRADAIALASLIATIAVTGILPILLNPLIDYSATVQENGTKLMIEIKNLGLDSANNVMSSVSAKDVEFSSFESEPFLANHFRANTSILGKGFFEISIIPPRSETFVYATLNASRADEKNDLIVYLRSDERVGFHDTLITSIFYSGLGVTYVMLFIYLVYWRHLVGSTYAPHWKKLNHHKIREIVYYVLVIAGVEIFVTVIYYYIYFPFPFIFDLPPV
jgi:hypothetical protein